MKENILTIDCYTDASYSKEANGSFIGYIIGDEPMVTEFCLEIKNTQGELMAIEKCLSVCNTKYPDHQIHIHTDCQKAIDQYQENGSIVFHKMQGHMKKSLMNDKQKIFSLVDRRTRKELRIKCKIKKDSEIIFTA